MGRDEESARSRIGREIDLPLPTAIWVLGVHVLTILAPLLVVWAVASHRAELDLALDQPAFLYVYAMLLVVASVCESAQNTADRWYLYGVPPSLLDLVFNSLVALALVFATLAAFGDTAWVWPLVLVLWACYPVGYVLGLAPLRDGAQAAVGVSAIGALYVALDEPVVLLSLVAVFLTLYFLDLLVRTRQQVFHGFTTGVNAVGLLSVVAALAWTGTPAGWGWPVVLGLAALVVAGALAARPSLLRLPGTPRRSLVRAS